MGRLPHHRAASHYLLVGGGGGGGGGGGAPACVCVCVCVKRKAENELPGDKSHQKGTH